MKKDKIFRWIKVAKAISEFSKDPSTKVGTIMVSADGRQISSGYNGWVAGCDESQMTWDRPLKYLMILHSEMNAILFSKESLKGAVAISTQAPCESCLKHMAQAGISEIHYDDSSVMRERGSDDQKEAIKRLIEATGIVVRNVNTDIDYIQDLKKQIIL